MDLNSSLLLQISVVFAEVAGFILGPVCSFYEQI